MPSYSPRRLSQSEIISKRGHSDIRVTDDWDVTIYRDRDAEAAEAVAKIVA
jgi:hypothetical protein